MTATTAITTNTLQNTAIPTSVRGAPAHLRRLIRKKQNSESAKRCRLRRKQEAERYAGKTITTAQQMANLEAMVAHLTNNLVQTQNALAALISSAPQSLTREQSQLLQPHLPETMTTATNTTATSNAPTLTLEIPSFEMAFASAQVPTSPITPTEPISAPISPEMLPTTSTAAFDAILDEVASGTQDTGSPLSDFDLHNFASAHVG